MSFEVNDFETQVVQRSREVPVLVDFWAPWCGPCRTLGPALERLAGQAGGRWELAKVNTEDHQELAAAFNIASIPAVKLFVNGQVVDEFVGALPESQIRRFLERALPSPHAKQLAEARLLLAEGANAPAARILDGVLEAEPSNDEVRVLLAQALLGTAPDQTVELLGAVGLESDYADKAGALRILAHLGQIAGKPTALPESSIRDSYLAGITAVRSGDYAKALRQFIAVLERDKEYDSGGAKAACKAVFQLLGPRHELVERYFRAFSSALHS